jgi:hypothetical protein
MDKLTKFKLIRSLITISIIVIFIIGAFLVWFIFIEKNVLTNIAEKITAIIAFFGILISGIQILINEIKRKREFYKQLRYSEYKSIRNQIQKFTNLLNDHLVNEPNPHLLENKLMNITNELAVTINTSNSKLFPGIIDNENSKNFDNLISDILIRTSQYRKKFDDIRKNQKKQETSGDFEIKINAMNWHNEIVTKLKEVHSEKYKLFEFLENYI